MMCQNLNQKKTAYTAVNIIDVAVLLFVTGSWNVDIYQKFNDPLISDNVGNAISWIHLT